MEVNLAYLGKKHAQAYEITSELCSDNQWVMQVFDSVEALMLNWDKFQIHMIGESVNSLSILDIQSSDLILHSCTVYFEGPKNESILRSLTFRPNEHYAQPPFRKGEIENFVNPTLDSKMDLDEIVLGAQTKLNTKELTLKVAAKSYKLSIQEAGLLSMLIQGQSMLVSKKSIMNQIWGESTVVSQARLRTLVMHLRDYLRDAKDVELITHAKKGLELKVH